MILKLSGLVETGDSSRVGVFDELDGYIHIGGKDFLSEVAEKEFKNPVTVAIADERFSGDLDYDFGWGYSEYTPMESDEMKVGTHDVLEILSRYEGKTVTVWIADEPINTLED